jgi:hypothetical protein
MSTRMSTPLVSEREPGVILSLACDQSEQSRSAKPRRTMRGAPGLDGSEGFRGHNGLRRPGTGRPGCGLLAGLADGHSPGGVRQAEGGEHCQ